MYSWSKTYRKQFVGKVGRIVFADQKRALPGIEHTIPCYAESCYMSRNPSSSGSSVYEQCRAEWIWVAGLRLSLGAQTSLNGSTLSRPSLSGAPSASSTIGIITSIGNTTSNVELLQHVNI
jgi:hypothetical protein